jgi:type I restriction enzyme M protein
VETDKKGKSKDKGWACDLIPKPLIVARYFAKEQAAIERLQAELEAAAPAAELEEEHGGEEGCLRRVEGFDSISAATVKERIREIGRPGRRRRAGGAERSGWTLSNASTALKKQLREGPRRRWTRWPTPSTPR